MIACCAATAHIRHPILTCPKRMQAWPPQFILIPPVSPSTPPLSSSLAPSPPSILPEPAGLQSIHNDGDHNIHRLKHMDPPPSSGLVSIPAHVQHETHVWNALAAGKVLVDRGMYHLASRSFLHGIRLRPTSSNILVTLVCYNFASRLLSTLDAFVSSAHASSESSRISTLSYAAAVASLSHLSSKHTALGMQLLASSQLNLGKCV
jgi:hypothetical protein